jgi:hypothetical protein
VGQSANCACSFFCANYRLPQNGIAFSVFVNAKIEGSRWIFGKGIRDQNVSKNEVVNVQMISG